jgi:hypothetical protein
LAPAASDALGWDTVKTSGVLGLSSIVIFVIMMVVMFLSGKGVADAILVLIGLSTWTVGGTLIYFLWIQGAPAWHFVTTVMISISGFPFVLGSNRSLFTKAVNSKPELETSQGFMQALLSMFSSVAGFV